MTSTEILNPHICQSSYTLETLDCISLANIQTDETSQIKSSHSSGLQVRVLVAADIPPNTPFIIKGFCRNTFTKIFLILEGSFLMNINCVIKVSRLYSEKEIFLIQRRTD